MRPTRRGGPSAPGRRQHVLTAGPGGTFAVTLTVEGVYDYYCTPHEPAGMVGRIIVGRPAGPAALPLDVYRARYADKGWEAPPPAALSAFPEIAAIMRDRIVRRTA